MNQLMECLDSYNINYAKYRNYYSGHSRLMINIGWSSVHIYDCFMYKFIHALDSAEISIVVDNDIECDNTFKYILQRFRKEKFKL